MTYGIRLRAWGALACFTRPEMKAERVSYDVMTPSAARGIIESVYWKPQIRWVIDRIHVLRPIQFASLRRNELGSKIPAGAVESAMKNGAGALGVFIEEGRQQRAATVLRDVEYIVEAHFDVLEARGSAGESLGPKQAEAKHLDQFNRRARAGQCFHRPYFGCREFACDFELVAPGEPIGPRYGPPRDGSEVAEAFYGTDRATRDLGFMLHDVAFIDDPAGEIVEGSAGRRVRAVPKFFRARMDRGVIEVPRPDSGEVHS